MNAAEFQKRILPVMMDKSILPVVITIKDLWILLSALGLGMRHPRITGPMRARLVGLEAQFEQAIIRRHPKTKLCFEPGIGKGSFMRHALPAMQDPVPLMTDIFISDAYIIVVSIQATVRHPGLDPEQRDALVTLGWSFQNHVVALHPQVGEVLDMGWDKRFDHVEPE